MPSIRTKVSAFLLVEGPHDLHVVSALCLAHNVPETFEIKSPKQQGGRADGLETLLGVFREEITANDRKAIGIMLDADDQLERRWERLLNIIEQTRLGYDLPTSPDPKGTIISTPDGYAPRIGIWLMPDNRTPGELENFVALLIPNEDKLSPFAYRVLDEIEQVNLHLYNKKSKAFIHTWLAWQKEPGMPMGQAITATVLSATSPTAVIFVNWLNRLFN